MLEVALILCSSGTSNLFLWSLVTLKLNVCVLLVWALDQFPTFLQSFFLRIPSAMTAFECPSHPWLHRSQVASEY